VLIHFFGHVHWIVQEGNYGRKSYVRDAVQLKKAKGISVGTMPSPSTRCLPHNLKTHSGHRIKEHEMGKSCCIHGTAEKFNKSLVKKYDLGKIPQSMKGQYKIYPNHELLGCGLHLFDLRQGPVGSFCEHASEPSGRKRRLEFGDQF
jgi:hypothetical protein